MPIKVNVSLSAGGQLKPVSSRSLDGEHITIGRDKECTLTLEDTQKHVSRVHAELDVEAGIYWMTVVSKVNPVMVNGKRHMLGERVTIADGDVLTIGLYKLEILFPPAAPPVPEPRPVVPPPADFGEDMTYIPPVQAEAPTSPLSPIPDDFSEDMTYVPPARSRTPAQPPLSALADADLDSTYIPPTPAENTPDEEVTYVRHADELTNPLGRAMPATAPPPEEIEEDFSEDMTYVRRPAAEPEVPQQSVTQVAPPREAVEEDFSEDATYVRPPAASAPAPQSAAAEPAAELDIDLDIEIDFDLSEEITQYHPSPQEESPSEEPTRFGPAEDPPAAPPAPAAAAALNRDDTTGNERALQAFLQGAGIRNLEVDDPEAFLRDSGTTFLAAIEGLVMLLAASTGVKKSLGAEAIDDADANPLTRMSDPRKVTAFLLDPAKRAGDGPEPIELLDDACSDLRVHQIALMAAFQAAVLGVLQSVDPKKIERDQGGNLSGLSLTRKSKLWDLAVAHHEKVSSEIGESIHRVFGPEAQAAYVAEVRRIRGER